MPDHLNVPYLRLSADDLDVELRQLEDEGRDAAALRAEFDRVKGLDLQDPANQSAAQAMLDHAAGLPMRPDYPYAEPSGLREIRAARAGPVDLPALRLSSEQLLDRVHGAWLGRACGCLLGKAVEGWHRPRIWGYLKDAGRWPLSDYFTLNVPPKVAAKYDVGSRAGHAFIDEVDCMPEDDDTNYTVIGLAVMAGHGRDFTPLDVARFWMSHLPILHTYSAERVAYRNLVAGIVPPRSATFRNPFREWIGAQIRGDFFGYAAPGRPELAAELAWRDASVSHVANGIYGEMWVAAMLAAAFVTDDVPAVVRAGLAQIPARSRLHESISEVLQWRAGGVEYDEAVKRIHRRWDETSKHDWCHVISNAAIVAVGLLWGGLDFGRSICRAVQCCFDTDCNGATVGSILGAVVGARALPGKWTEPIHDTMLTGVAGYHRVAVSDLARQTVDVTASLHG
ncbi:MAG TPA: ADP-ribosylglycohydrolase family protein [Phycisphaerae bacterium]|nr:ADP-ribosylglycohydrolase family protein [Phycisphaerae bacterium]